MFKIQMHHKDYPKAIPGDNVGMQIKGFDKMNMPKAGDVIYKPSEGKLKPVKSFTAMINVQDHPGQLKPGFAQLYMLEQPKCHVR